MQELAGRLTALDPDASASLEVIAHFDALIAAGAGLEAMVRAAAVLAAAPAGTMVGTRRVRIEPDGQRVDPASAEGESHASWPLLTMDGRTVWLEREGAPHANDAMILERLAIAVAVVQSRRAEPAAGSVELLLDPTLTEDARATALARLRLDGTHTFEVVASLPSGAAPADGPSVVVATADGLLRAQVVAAGSITTVPDATRVGIATATAPDEIPRAWHDARLLLRLADQHDRVKRADELGALMLLVRSFDPHAEPPSDVATLTALDAPTRRILSVLVHADSVRSAASALSMHHSTLQARHEALVRQLGYDPRSPWGRVRFEAADLLARLSDPR